MALSTEAQKPEGSLTDNTVTTGQLTGGHHVGESLARTQVTHDMKDIYPYMYLPVVENTESVTNFMHTQTVCPQITTQ